MVPPTFSFQWCHILLLVSSFLFSVLENHGHKAGVARNAFFFPFLNSWINPELHRSMPGFSSYMIRRPPSRYNIIIKLLSLLSPSVISFGLHGYPGCFPLLVID